MLLLGFEKDVPFLLMVWFDLNFHPTGIAMGAVTIKRVGVCEPSLWEGLYWQLPLQLDGNVKIMGLGKRGNGIRYCAQFGGGGGGIVGGTTSAVS